MLRITEGGFASGAYEDIKKEILSHIERGERTFLITPEQQSVIAESELVKILPKYAPLYFEVTNFTRFANTVYRSIGGLAGNYADSGKEALIMWRTLTELSPFLRIFKGEVNVGMVDKALAATAEMKSLAIGADELSALADDKRLESKKRLAAKLSDISKVIALYDKLLIEKYSSTRDECERLAAKLSENPSLFSDVHFYLTGFTSFTEPQYRVLGELMKFSTVTVHLTVGRAEEDSFEFSEIKKTKESLFRTADACMTKKELRKNGTISPDKSLLIAEACGLLWHNFGKIDNESLQNEPGAIRILEASDPYEESGFIAADIKRRVMSGAAYRDFAIVARDSDKYLGILDTALSEAGIPYFISKRKNISAYEPIKFIYTAFSVVESGFSREDVISYAKCGLCGIDRNACDEFEIYTDIWQINKSRFYDDNFWTMSPGGYDSALTEEDGEMLARIDNVRHTLIDPLVKLSENLKAARTVREHATALVEFLTECELEKRIIERCEKFRALGETDAAEENERLWGAICSSLDSLVEVLSDFEVTTRAFISQVKIILDSKDLGKIPTFYDEVTVGSADMLRLSQKKEVYLIGVNRGEFPRRAESNAYFSDADKAVLSELGLNTDADAMIPLAREAFFFSRAFSSASRRVTLSYTLRDEALTASKRSDVIDRIIDICNDVIKPIRISEIPTVEKIYYPAMALPFIDNDAVMDALAKSGYQVDATKSEIGITNADMQLSTDSRSSLYKDTMKLTQSRIDSYVNCPFAYFLRYNLKLSEWERAEFNARNIGTFIHAVLENFFSELRHDGGIDTLTSEKKQEMVERAAKKYLNSQSHSTQNAKKRESIMLDRLCRASMPLVDTLCDELAGSEFLPRFFELKIDEQAPDLPRPATFVGEDGQAVKVYGTIDRVDTYKTENGVYVKVIDYKTGAKAFSPSDIDEGKNLQMFLYLKAIVEADNEGFRNELGADKGEKIIPAGVIYVKADMSDVTVPHENNEEALETIKNNQARRGMLLNDKESIGAMNKEYIPINFKKDGTPDARSQKYLYTEKGWDDLNDKIKSKVLEISGRMKSGDISLSKSNVRLCDVCKFKPVCRRK